MFSSILFFLLGVIAANVFRSRPRADMLLYWNRDCLGWRPVVRSTEINSEARYLAAFEVEPSLAKYEVNEEHEE